MEGREFDAQVVLSPKDSPLGKVLSEYVCVRVARMDDVDVALFDRAGQLCALAQREPPLPVASVTGWHSSAVPSLLSSRSGLALGLPVGVSVVSLVAQATGPVIVSPAGRASYGLPVTSFTGTLDRGTSARASP